MVKLKGAEKFSGRVLTSKKIEDIDIVEHPLDHASSDRIRTTIREIDIDRIDPDDGQPRKFFEIDGMAESIKSKKVLQPVTVARKEDGRFRLILGERRFRGAKAAGCKVIPSIIYDSLQEDDIVEMRLIENIQRQDLLPVEESIAIKHFIEQKGVTQKETGARIGKDPSYVSQALSIARFAEQYGDNELLKLSAKNKDKLYRENFLQAASLGIEKGRALLQRIINEGLTVREVREARPLKNKHTKRKLFNEASLSRTLKSFRGRPSFAEYKFEIKDMSKQEGIIEEISLTQKYLSQEIKHLETLKQRILK